jgi:hypothetical protein
MYFVPVDDPSKAVKVARVAENMPTKITGIAPQTGFANNRIEIRTQFAGAGNKFLKAPRVIASGFILRRSVKEAASMPLTPRRFRLIKQR